MSGCAGINESKNVYILPEQLCTRVMVMDFCYSKEMLWSIINGELIKCSKT